ncbi:hypothetical protein [Lysobacter sp. ESA13C]|uniref:hypothetical protein n=1 Tax=Lysobacter sp. ESA13C TaxID=2862676 RepID=UPI001CBD733F|nr:hypothetical protein [Lysobacter sp. ESA13C]
MPAVLLPLLCFIAFLAFAPEAAMKFAAWFLVTTAVVRVAADKAVDLETGWGEAAKAVIWAAALPLLAIFGLLSFGLSTGITQFEGLAAIAILVMLSGSFVAAFMLALHTSLKDSAIIASITTVASAAMAMLVRALA